MIFLKRVLFFPCVLNTFIFLVFLCRFVIGDEPCSGDPGQLAKYRPCGRGQRLEKSCTQRCVSCDAGTNYQDTFTNCSTCLPCKTAEDCLPGEIIRNCTVDSDTVCGCPPPPPCPVCPPCPTATFCPSVTPCPAQTECPACEYPTYAPGFQNNDDRNSCVMCWNLIKAIFPGAALIVLIVLIAIIVKRRRCTYRKRNPPKADHEAQHLEVVPNEYQGKDIEFNRLPKSNDPNGDGTEDGSAGPSDADIKGAPMDKRKHKPHTPAGCARNDQTKELDEGTIEIPKDRESVALANSMQLTFQFLSEKLSKEWRDVGRQLNLEDAQLDQIEQDSKITKETIYNMFKTWKQLNGKNATFPVLMEALKKQGRQDVVDHLKYWKNVMVHQP